ncbi:peptide deformylase [Candidatus Roizmanbacteria bacterium]|nr:peptide deformylase [Candidatus Roizmanbacteria bacterium]
MPKIVSAPNSILTTPVKHVEKVDDSIKKLIKEMVIILNEKDNPRGVGLAANQLGVGLAIFIMKPVEKEKVEVFINPRILKSEEKVIVQRKSSKRKKKQPLEGCLSIPKVWAPVKRSPKVLLEYQDENCKVHRQWFNKLRAVIVQHEVDHLNGILFTQRALEQNSNLYEEKDGKLKKMDY